MPSPEGVALISRQRSAQIALRAITARDIQRIWALFDPFNISRSWDRIEPLLLALIRSRQPLSTSIAADYYQAFRAAERIAGTVRFDRLSIPTVDELIPNLRLVGPAHALEMQRVARPAGRISQVALSNVEGEVVRQILNGGRGSIVNTVHADDQADGWRRITDGDPCAFCALLATRGTVYKSEDTGDFEAHRKCACTARAMYRDEPLSPQADRWLDLYHEAYAHTSTTYGQSRSREVRATFRRMYEAQR